MSFEHMEFSELAFHRHLARPGTIIDVGANVGQYSRHFSTWERTRLIAFEPFPGVFQLLQANLIKQHGGKLPANTELHMVALGDAVRMATMRAPNVAGEGIIHQWASLTKNFEGIEGVTVHAFEVPVWTVDGLRVDDVTAMKIDAEGSEIEVVNGARLTIERCRPIVSCECEERHRQGVTWYVPGFMKALDYDGWFFYQGQFWPVSSLDRSTMQVASASGPPESDPYISAFMFCPRELGDLRNRMLDFGSFRPG